MTHTHTHTAVITWNPKLKSALSDLYTIIYAQQKHTWYWSQEHIIYLDFSKDERNASWNSLMYVAWPLNERVGI